MSRETVNVDLVFIGPHKDARAWLFKDASGRKIYLPDSQIVFDYAADTETVVDVEMPEWLANTEGLI